MSRLSTYGGWLLYSGKMGSITAEVAHASMDWRVTGINVTSISSPYTQFVPGPPDITLTAQLTVNTLWDRESETKPPNFAALMALARRHPEEYLDLCEGEDILKALGG